MMILNLLVILLLALLNINVLQSKKWRSTFKLNSNIIILEIVRNQINFYLTYFNTFANKSILTTPSLKFVSDSSSSTFLSILVIAIIHFKTLLNLILTISG